MEAHDVGEVVQVIGPEAANQKLSEGWSLLAVVPTQTGVGQAQVAYVLGKPRKSRSVDVMVPERLHP
ncbi:MULTISPECIES: hypothetical protein [Pseudomonas]|uniref:hypothetical protein n=1 Tax=Pseudomonas TaxID=286 RepID=UPI001179A4D5|nr:MULTISPECIES: hypothetical protein [Pseudomonas]EKT4452260.1 hypothetical protein [Pseudomonas putida]MCE0965974.1 hypothetical protein [Pseudomonas sp. NMI4491_12]MDD2070164.1 hypothetical protein [Pseudomonas putida]HDS1742917.1 hypothetical protein [Pseudomonas putida]